jgi:hypothetical protein
MRKILTEENPVLANEWDYKKNGDLRPENFTGGSNKKVWWRCELGHSWFAQISKRFTLGRGCPYCSGNKVWLGFNDLVTTHPDIASEWDYSKNRDLRPEQFSIGADVKIWWKCQHCGHNWQAVLYSRKHCGCPACARNITISGVNDLRTVNPHLAAEWDYERNGEATPDTVAANSNKAAWWRCELGHSWRTTIDSRNVGRGCPYCTNRKLMPGFNDLLTVAPELAIQWHYEKNGDLRPENVLAGSHKSVWWLCSHGHQWKAKITNRRLGTGCPYDAGKLIITGETDLKTRYPALCEEWDYVKNGQLRPETMACHSNKMLWWTCQRGHSFRASTANRTSGSGCPYCSGKRPFVGETDFGTVHPELIDEWDNEKNGKLRPEHVVAGSHKKVWWRCSKGHSWKTQVQHRHKGNGCPYCSGLLAIVGKNDFATINPALLSEWDYERNDGISPDDVKSYSNKKVWWICKKGHRWLSTIGARHAGSTCPYCLGLVQMRTRLVK